MMLTVAQAAEKLGVCTKTILRRIASKQLPAYRDGYRTIRIDEKDLNVYLDKRKIV